MTFSVTPSPRVPSSAELGHRASFDERYAAALDNPNIRDGLLNFQRDWRQARDSQIVELESIAETTFAKLSADFAVTKARTRADWPMYQSAFEAKATAAGATVHHAVDADAARRIIAELLHSAGATKVVKTKSMVTEEIFLNDHLAAEGIEAVETDLGEWLLQLIGDHPSHLVLPAIHKRKAEIAKILTDATGEDLDPEAVADMVRAARRGLRKAFFAADAGITGANALIAETGSVMLITNEGNATLTHSLPRLQIVLAGYDKLVPDMVTAMDQVRLLARSATGQRMTTYTSMITGPGHGQDLHVVIIDNGRSVMAADPGFADALACIRCGACADVCPPYQVVGGHVFGHVYTGAIGLVNTPFHHDPSDIAKAQELCVSCGACATACPANIPLSSMILKTRSREYERNASKPMKALMRAFSSRRLVAAGSVVAGLASIPLGRDGHLRLPVPARHAWRKLPALPLVPARRRLGKKMVPATYRSEITGKEVALFIQCVTDRAAPDIATSSETLIQRAGGVVVVPPKQHCCGLPAFDSGDWKAASRMLCQTIETFAGYPYVVTPASSCLAAIAEEYDMLVERDPSLAAPLADLRSRMYDMVSLLEGPARALDLESDSTSVLTTVDVPGGGKMMKRVGVHRFCQSTNLLGRSDELERLIESRSGIELIELPEASVCCGFGGASSVKLPEVSAKIVERKLDNVEGANLDILITDNPGCVLHLRAAAAAEGRVLEVMHMAEFLAQDGS